MWARADFIAAINAPMTIDSFLQELQGISGDFRLTFVDGAHAHLSSPLSADNLLGLRGECEAGAAAGIGPLVVRFSVTGPPRADGCVTIVRHYAATSGGVARFSARLTQYQNNTDSFSGAALGDEPGVAFD